MLTDDTGLSTVLLIYDEYTCTPDIVSQLTY